MNDDHLKKLEKRIADNTRAKGAVSEQIAENHLISKNYTIIKKNFKFGSSSEVDIIAEDRSTLVFVEVKSSKGDTFGDPLYSVNQAKQRAIRTAARGYLYVNKITNRDCRFDVIAITFKDGNPIIQHIENAF
ncbi:MAG: YraN family protein [Candidatus Kapabacteria bacterium]|nr:YraN family protein [Candidatus Kapabacteria bacterium]